MYPIFTMYKTIEHMVFTHLLKNECPRCHEGKAFQNSNLFSFRDEVMNKECPVCHLNFTREPGFYWGAMYVSYALAVLEVLVTYFICRIAGSGTFDLINLWIILSTILLLSPFNYRISRLVWLYMFPK